MMMMMVPTTDAHTCQPVRAHHPSDHSCFRLYCSNIVAPMSVVSSGANSMSFVNHFNLIIECRNLCEFNRLVLECILLLSLSSGHKIVSLSLHFIINIFVI